MKLFGIIVAGGGGRRFGTLQPKQFQLLAGRPMLMHPIATFYKAVPGIQLIVVLPEEYIPVWKKLCIDYQFDIPHSLINGGPERFHSVKRGLSLVVGDGLVAIHDGARPLVSPAIITEAIRMAKISRAVLPAVVPSDSVRQVIGNTNKPMVREELRLIQTPQVFDISLIKKAYLQNYHPSFTDDATVVESIGISVSLIEGGHENIKITRPADLLLAEALLNAMYKRF
ncbi:MAG: 2-C-methyl-D-erythritol 4-phosphate cytidylyltransferase [Bacteroidales bacterium]|nr:2-C-methyl-D-erythritol 4-phosphate cytidylyltransferase [Bacteroidales bacterium]MDZ4204377.1 2-C-methyl-D-erythritol 4-phosphate cytidylyltransferase [Bacteroidales bacterium]